MCAKYLQKCVHLWVVDFVGLALLKSVYHTRALAAVN